MESAYAQNSPVKGKITDSSGAPLPGASIKEKGTTNGILTSNQGLFTINAAGTATLTISAIGYITQEIAVNNRKYIEVKLADNNETLQEIVINGAYGTANKSTYTGSATVVSAAKIQSTQPTNISQALQGMSPGVQVLNTNGAPGSNGEITIRGLSSVGGNNSPLYVLDGMPYNGDLSAINPNDVESMTVLKDASATSLYGSRAANGVIVITSKKGTSTVPLINLRTNFGFSDMAVQYPEKLNPGNLFELAWEAIRNGQTDQGKSAAEAAQYATDRLVGYYFQNPAQNVFNTPTPIGLDGKLKSDAVQLYNGDWFGELFSRRLRQEHTLDISGSAGQDYKTQYFISGSYLNDKGSFNVQEFERYSGRLNLTSQLKKWLTVGTNISYSHSFQQNPGVEARFTRVIPTVYPVYEWDYENNQYQTDPYGNLMPDFGNSSRTEWRGWNPGFMGEYKNAYDWNFGGIQKDNLSTRSFAEITFIPGLKLRSGISTDLQQNNSLDYQSATLTSSAGYGGWAGRNASRNFSYTFNNLLTYEHAWDKHHINILAGQENYKLKYNNVYTSGEGFTSGGLYELDATAVRGSTSSYEDNYRLQSYLSRAEYDFDRRYYLSASFRKDGSSRFHPDNRWGNFWSVGASWLLNEENFLKDTKWINSLKLRASYGTVGNDKVAVGYYAYQGLYSSGWNDNGNPGVLLSSLPTPNLIWESNVQTDVGIDFSLFGHRIHGTLDWFNRTTKDLIFNRPLAPSVGIPTIAENVGDVKNTGLELELGAKLIQGSGLNWSVDLNASRYKNKITRLPQNEIYEGRFKLTEGVSRYEFFGPVWAGVNPENGNNTWWKFTENGQERTEDYTSVNTTSQMRYLGSSIPDLFGALTNNFSYKGFDLSIMMYYSIGGKMYDGDYAEGVRWRRGFNMSVDALDRWTPENRETDIPRLSEYTQNNISVYSSQYLFDNTFLRLRNLSLGYTLPSAISKKYGLNSVKIYAQGTNLLTWGNAANRGTDPETTVNGIVSNGPNGTATGSVRKSWSVGLQAAF
ncbi:SusC/RagA family TonB-linked outer membrane protein [Pedobacter sp. AW31-3R]|uniref:SusC/RagA family TonB-linked outer membrane protein n=1 Tax=Pedobacter sp. AW31-3R TaxID=3445781 RepID=UPI003FA11A33